MWVLTTSGGLNLAQGTDLKALRFLNYSTKNGMPSDVLLSCTEDNLQNLWIATQNSISRFSLKQRQFQNFNYNHGFGNVSISEASCAKLKNGDIAFGTTKGCVIFNPAAIKTTKIVAPMALTGLQVNSHDVSPGEGSILKTDLNNTGEVELKYDQNILSITFATLDYHDIDKREYAFRLIGFDNVWRKSEGQRRATYTKLPPGKYTFEVKGLNDELYEKTPFKSLQITILPPPWRTWWAYIIYFIIVLTGLVLARNIVLTVLRLRQGIEVERRLAELKLRFFTQVSHELRTPLTLIINPSEEIKEHEKLSERGQQYIDVVVKNSRRMLRMVNQVLDLRKIQSGKAELHIEETEMSSFISRIVDYFKEDILQKKLRISFKSEKEFQAKIDQEKIEIVVFNLLANAIKFSPVNGVIYIDIYKEESSSNLILIVKDEGPGVQEGELTEIFKLYYEGRSTARTVKGTGIGLALAKELVELHGGSIHAEHNDPKGLKVVVSLSAKLIGSELQNLPFFSAEEQLTAATKMELNSESEVSQPLEKASILIVEDNDDLRNFLAAKLSDWYRVETAVDGQDGLQKVRLLNPDLIVSDIMMPNVDGIQLLDRVKNDPETSHIPVILLTARYSVESQIEALRYGADYYVTKPFKMELLQLAMANIIASRKRFLDRLQESQDASAADDVAVDEMKESEDEVVAHDVVITDYDRRFLEKVIGIIERYLQDAQFNIEDVADSLKMSRSSFYRKFRSLTGMAPVELVRELRLKKAKALFDSGNVNVANVAYEVGFSNPKYFSTCFKNQFLISPSEYLKSVLGK